jgi:PadR family transcriptional regulator PadR
LDIQLKKGLLDAIVLAAVKKGDVYGYKLLQDVLTVIEVSESTLYPILRRLETQGCLQTYQQQHDGRLRKYYSITKSGELKLKEYRQQCLELANIINFIFQ